MMYKIFQMLLILVALNLFSGGVMADARAGNKVLFIGSYHQGYAWEDGIIRGVRYIFNGSPVNLKIIRMDTKRNTSDAFKKAAAIKARAVIESYRPDVVIAADDNASKFLIEPYYKDGSLPIVFCGINWDASEYGFPATNVTGMIEVTPIPQLLNLLKPLAKGDKVGFLAPDILTARKEVKNYSVFFDLKCISYFAKDVEDWKKGFIKLQQETDILIIASHGGLYANKEQELIRFVENHTRVPTGSCYDFMAPYALLSYGKVAEEQGSWAARTALEILNGKSPQEIPVARNQKGRIFINGRIAEVTNAQLPYEVIALADTIIQ